LGSQTADTFSIAASEGKVEMLELMCVQGVGTKPPQRLYRAFGTAVIAEQIAAAEYLRLIIEQVMFQQVFALPE